MKSNWCTENSKNLSWPYIASLNRNNKNAF